MNTVSDRDVDEIYRRGLAALVAHSRPYPATTRQTGRRRVPVFLAIVGLGIPLAALAVSAFLVIDHARHSAMPPAISGSSVSKTGIGHTVQITDSHGLIADVTVEKVSYATSGEGGASPPVNGFYAVADVLISTTSAIGSTVSSQELNSAQGQLNVQLGILAQEKVNGDTAKVPATITLITLYQHEVTLLLAQQLLPFAFTYQTNDGRTYPAFFDNALESGFDPMLLAAGGLPKGLTYGNVVFDVPLKGGVIQMTDPSSGIVGRWRLPAS
jgi:hypothetical protein